MPGVVPSVSAIRLSKALDASRLDPAMALKGGQNILLLRYQRHSLA